MDLVTALAVSIGLLGGAATYLYLSDFLGLGLQIWAAFIAWASFYHCGGKVQGFTSSILANLWGVLWGALTLIAFSNLDFGTAGTGVGRHLRRDRRRPHDPRLQDPDLLGDPRHGLRLRRHCRLRAADERRRRPGRPDAREPCGCHRTVHDRRRHLRPDLRSTRRRAGERRRRTRHSLPLQRSQRHRARSLRPARWRSGDLCPMPTDVILGLVDCAGPS